MQRRTPARPVPVSAHSIIARRTIHRAMGGTSLPAGPGDLVFQVPVMLLLLIGVFAALPWLGGCNDSQRAPQPGDNAPPVESARAAPPASRAETDGGATPKPPQFVLDVDLPDPTRWVYAEKVRGDADGGSVTGTFHKSSNKIEIHTRDVERFSIDTSKIEIDWTRRVILGINGSNTGLGRREHPIIRFALDDYGKWVVVE
ncbi:MAG: hypothetical protein IID36_02335 [Planctomycetes bacterium]|nr:hypothetical protein [Planctomycetota bacterium]